MKKLFALAIVSLFVFSACGGGSSAARTEDKNENIVNFLVDAGCTVAKYNGQVPDSEVQAINEKYGFTTDADVDAAIKLLTFNEAIAVKEKALPMITAKCKEDFAKISFTAENFLDVAILPRQLNK